MRRKRSIQRKARGPKMYKREWYSERDFEGLEYTDIVYALFVAVLLDLHRIVRYIMVTRKIHPDKLSTDTRELRLYTPCVPDRTKVVYLPLSMPDSSQSEFRQYMSLFNDPVKFKSQEELSALSLAAVNGCLDSCQVLIEFGSDPTYRNFFPLQLALAFGRVPVVELLLPLGKPSHLRNCIISAAENRLASILHSELLKYKCSHENAKLSRFQISKPFPRYFTSAQYAEALKLCVDGGMNKRLLPSSTLFNPPILATINSMFHHLTFN